MPELDLFESRFAAAYRRYLDEAPTEVDAAMVARTVAAHPRARTVVWPWAFRPAQTLVWLVLILLLLAAVGAAAVYMGSQRPALGFACPPGAHPDAPGPVGQARPSSPLDGLVFDRGAGKVVATVQGATWTFDICTNTWVRKAAAPFTDRARLVYDADSDVTIAVEGSQAAVWTYDLAADDWTRRGAAPWPSVGWVRLADVPGPTVLAAVSSDPAEIWSYDVRSDAWTLVRRQGAADLPGDQRVDLLAYDASIDRIVADASCPGWGMPCSGVDRTVLLNPRTGTWSLAAAGTPGIYRDIHGAGGEIAYDEAAERTVVFSMSDGDFRVFAYDAIADRWETLWGQAVDGPSAGGIPAGPGGFLTGWMVYDSVNERLVVAGTESAFSGRHPNGGWADDVWAFDTATRQWVELLAPSRP